MPRNTMLQQHIFARTSRDANALLMTVRNFKRAIPVHMMIGEYIAKQGVAASGATSKHMMEGRMQLAIMVQQLESIRGQIGNGRGLPLHHRQHIKGLMKRIEKELMPLFDEFNERAAEVQWKADLPKGTGGDLLGDSLEMVVALVDTLAEIFGGGLEGAKLWRKRKGR